MDASPDEPRIVRVGSTGDLVLSNGSTLTRREAEILALVAQGRRNREIAAELFLSVHTIEYHASHIFQKLGVRNRTEAGALALRVGILGPYAVLESAGAAELGKSRIPRADRLPRLRGVITALRSLMSLLSRLGWRAGGAAIGVLVVLVTLVAAGLWFLPRGGSAKALDAYYLEWHSDYDTPLPIGRDESSGWSLRFSSDDGGRLTRRETAGFDANGQPLRYLSIVEGDTLWHYSEPGREYYQDSLASRPVRHFPAYVGRSGELYERPPFDDQARASCGWLFCLGPSPRGSIEDRIPENATILSRSQDIYLSLPVEVVELEWDVPGLRLPFDGPLRVTVWYDPVYDFVVKYTEETGFAFTARRSTVEVVELDYAPDYPDRWFVFSPPQDATEVSSPGGLRGLDLPHPDTAQLPEPAHVPERLTLSSSGYAYGPEGDLWQYTRRFTDANNDVYVVVEQDFTLDGLPEGLDFGTAARVGDAPAIGVIGGPESQLVWYEDGTLFLVRSNELPITELLRIAESIS